MITDRQHLLTMAERAIAAIEELARAWLHEDDAAARPAPGDGRSSGTPDPTSSLATTDRRHRHRDRLGGRLYTDLDRIIRHAATLRPRTPSGPCVCCHQATATHGNAEGNPTDCWACHRYRQHHGNRCDEQVHAGRPTPARMCECPRSCCDVCPDRAAEGRRLSDRCRQRKTRGAWEAA